MDKKDKYIKKDIYELISDLRVHYNLLSEASRGIRGGNMNYFIWAAIELRTLVCSGRGQIPLLLYLSDLFNYELKFKYNVAPPELMGKEEKLKTYLQKIGVKFCGEEKTNLQFIKYFCNETGNALHVKDLKRVETLSSDLIRISGLKGDQFQMNAIMNTVGNCLHDFIKYIDSLKPEEIEKINKKLSA